VESALSPLAAWESFYVIVRSSAAALTGLQFVVGACGVTGVVYGMRVVRHARRQTDYVPVLEDWIWHGQSLSASL
jgi:hypothetical protein